MNQEVWQRLPMRLKGMVRALPQAGETWTPEEHDAWLLLVVAMVKRYPTVPEGATKEGEA